MARLWIAALINTSSSLRVSRSSTYTGSTWKTRVLKLGCPSRLCRPPSPALAFHASSSFCITPLDGALGAEIGGLSDSVDRIDDNEFHLVYDAFLEYDGLIVLRDQKNLLTPARLVEAAKRFGPVSTYPFAKGMKNHPEITEIIKEPKQTSNFGGMWHSDTTYLFEPPKCTLLYAVQTPPRGLSDTLFSNMYKAHESLHDEMKSKLKGLKAINTSSLNADILRGNHLSSGTMQDTGVDSSTLQAKHPVVRIHPETGKLALFVNPSHTANLDGVRDDLSRKTLDFLFEHSVQPKFTFRVSWQPETLVVWDNRCTLHCAINDYDGFRRVMRRITIAGDIPV